MRLDVSVTDTAPITESPSDDGDDSADGDTPTEQATTETPVETSTTEPANDGDVSLTDEVATPIAEPDNDDPAQVLDNADAPPALEVVTVLETFRTPSDHDTPPPRNADGTEQDEHAAAVIADRPGTLDPIALDDPPRPRTTA